VGNIVLLGYFKYTNFLISTFNAVSGANLQYHKILLPLGISFYTFQQITFLVDTFRNETNENNILNYILYVTFFPQLIMGPIVLHKEFVSQLDSLRTKILNYKNIILGISLFLLGLFKKVILADTFSIWANYGFNNSQYLDVISAWITSLSYTFQLYFDFSGYTDMALGVAQMFNIKLPQNFDRPYLSFNIQEFWRRWHITLMRFIKNYIYIPLGGNRKGDFRTYQNLIMAFLIGGIWHGAGWTFVLWGFLHGVAMVINRLWRRLNVNLPKLLSWIITFNFVNIGWIFFRAENIETAFNIIAAMAGRNGFLMPAIWQRKLAFLSNYGIPFKPINILDLHLPINVAYFIFFIVFYIIINIRDRVLVNFIVRKVNSVIRDQCKIYIWLYQQWWLTPIIPVMIFIGLLIYKTGGQQVSAFIYNQF